MATVLFLCAVIHKQKRTASSAILLIALSAGPRATRPRYKSERIASSAILLIALPAGPRATRPRYITKNHLSYLKWSYTHAPEKIRTPDTLVRSQVLYPAELLTHIYECEFVCDRSNSFATLVILHYIIYFVNTQISYYLYFLRKQ